MKYAKIERDIDKAMRTFEKKRILQKSRLAETSLGICFVGGFLLENNK